MKKEKRYWDKSENIPEYDPSFTGICGKYLDRSETYSVFKPIKFKNVKKFLDAGCGTGRHLINLPDHVKLYGLDGSGPMIEEAKKKVKNAKFFVSDVEKMPFPDNYFDVVISVRVLQHLTDHDRAVKEMCRVLKKGGKMIVMNYNRYTLLNLYKIIRKNKIRNLFGFPFKVLVGKSPFEPWKQPQDVYSGPVELKKIFKRNGLKVSGMRGSVSAQSELYGFFGLNQISFIRRFLPKLFKMAYRLEKGYGHKFPLNVISGRITVEGVKL
tara:strand:+ start:3351 stop:4154 length:804 start_codon:yes stop_codon:yes gene_type:complete